MRAVLPVVLLLALVPVTASAVTVQEIVTNAVRHSGARNLWLNLELLCLRPARVKPFAKKLAARLAPYQIDAVCGPTMPSMAISPSDFGC